MHYRGGVSGIGRRWVKNEPSCANDCGETAGRVSDRSPRALAGWVVVEGHAPRGLPDALVETLGDAVRNREVFADSEVTAY
jgi:hypothetical protein